MTYLYELKDRITAATVAAALDMLQRVWECIITLMSAASLALDILKPHNLALFTKTLAFTF